MNARVLILALLLVCLTTRVSCKSVSTVDVVAGLFTVLGIKDVDAKACVSDGQGVELKLRAFEQELHAGALPQAMDSLSQAVSFLSSSISACDVKEVNMKLDALAAAIKFAKISTRGLDKTVNAIIGATNLITDIRAIASSVATANSQALAAAIGKTLGDFSMVTGGCGSSDAACKFVSGVLAVFQEVAADFAPCKAAIAPIVSSFEAAAASFESKRYESAVQSFAAALDSTSQALLSRSCGLARIGHLIGDLSPKLAAAVVTVEASGAVTIIVDSADVYNALYLAVRDVSSRDYASFGLQMGALLRVLRASDCVNAACAVLEGLLASAQLEASDVQACLAGAQTLWADVGNAVSTIEQGSLVSGVKLLGAVTVALAAEVRACGLPQLGQTAQKMLVKLNRSAAAAQIGSDATILADGADITLLVSQSVQDFRAQNYEKFGTDLGNLAARLSSSSVCQSIACEVVEGILSGVGTGYKSLKACEADVRKAERFFLSAAQAFERRQFDSAVENFAKALNIVSLAVSACGLQKEMGYIAQEANVFGLANATTALGNGVALLVHGADFYHEVFSSVQDVKQHDWRGAGRNLQQVMSQLNKWTGRFACRSNACFVVIGMLQYLGDVQGSVRACEGDFKAAFADFSFAYGNFSHNTRGAAAVFRTSQNRARIRAGVRSLGQGVQKVGAGVQACHLAALADILARLAVKLGVAPELAWLEEALHVLVEGVRIDEEVGGALVDWANKDWPGFGYQVVSLVETLL